MSNILTFPGKKPVVEPTAAIAQQVEASAEMVLQSSVMQLVSTLAFYAKGGFDHGAKAQAVMPAVRTILARRGIELVLQS